MWQRHALYLFVLVFVAGCDWQPQPPPPFSCSSFTMSHWQEFRFGADSSEDVAATVAKIWGIGKNQMEFELVIDDAVHYMSWRADMVIGQRGLYGAWIEDGQRLETIAVEWGYPLPTLSQIIECLGVPDSYAAFYALQGEVDYLNLTLLYPEIGIAVSHFAGSWTSESPKIHPDMKMQKFVVIPANTAEQMVTGMYNYGLEDELDAASACLLNPWPGSIDALEIASVEEKIQCGFFEN